MVKVKVVHLYSATSTGTYLQNTLELPPQPTPSNLGVKIPGSSQHTHAGWCLTCLPHSAMAILVLIYIWVW